WMRILGIAMLPAAFNMALMGMFMGAGATKTSLRINAWTTVVIQVPLGWVLGLWCELGPLGVGLSCALAFGAKAALGFVGSWPAASNGYPAQAWGAPTIFTASSPTRSNTASVAAMSAAPLSIASQPGQ